MHFDDLKLQFRLKKVGCLSLILPSTRGNITCAEDNDKINKRVK